jgi:hypothetical protein
MILSGRFAVQMDDDSRVEEHGPDYRHDTAWS